MSLANDVGSIPTIVVVGDVIDQLGKLIGNEVQLARAELSEKVAQAAIGVAYVVGACLLIMPKLVMLLIALALWLTEIGLSAVVSYLIAAAVGAGLSIVIGLVGLNRLKLKRLIPTVRIRQIEQDAAAVRELVK